jgi:hypothetical protein
VIDDVIVTSKRFPQTSDYEAIDVKTGKITSLGNFSNFVQKDQLDRHIIGEFEINPRDFEVVKLSSGEEDEQLIYYDQNDYAFYVKSGTERPFPDQAPFWTLIVRKNGVKIYETSEESKGYPFLFKKFDVLNSKFIYHKSYGSDTMYRIEGFYEVDLSTGSERLVHADAHPFAISVFDFEEKGMYAQRGDQFILMTKK